MQKHYNSKIALHCEASMPLQHRMLSSLRDGKILPPPLTDVNNEVATTNNTTIPLLHSTFVRVGRAFLCSCLMCAIFALCSCEKAEWEESEQEQLTRGLPADSTQAEPSIQFNIYCDTAWGDPYVHVNF